MNAKQKGLEYFHSLIEWRGNRKFDLENIRPVLERLGSPQNQLKTAQIAGTNGKGSVSAALASIMAMGGKKVGLNTSPHLGRVNERIIIDGHPVSDDFLGQYSIPVKEAADSLGINLSLFEAIMAISSLGFVGTGVEFGVFEVGLGGTFDATTTIKMPEVCSIVTIGFDHMDLLGKSLRSIARAKAGVIRDGGTIVTGDLPEEALEEIEIVVNERGARHIKFGRDFSLEKAPNGYVYKSNILKRLDFSPKLSGDHQAHNMAVAITMALIMGASVEECREGVANVFWPGRLEQTYFGSRACLIDCAHNPAGFETLTSYISNNKLGPFEVGFGVLKGRDWQSMIEMLMPHVNKWNLMLPDSDRAVPCEELQEFLETKGAEVSVYGGDYKTYLQSQLKSQKTTPILVCGSMYLVGGIRSIMVPNWKPLWTRPGL